MSRKLIDDEAHRKAREYAARWYAKADNAEKSKVKSSAWQKANPQKAKANSIKWRKANSQKVAEIQKTWYAANPAKVAAQRQNWTAKNPGRNAAIAREWYTNNTERAKAAQRKRYTPEQMAAKSLACKLRKQEHQAGRKKPKKCDVCKRTTKQICFEHDHTDNHFRGWTCSNCNFILGHAHDSAKLLRKLADYLDNDKLKQKELKKNVKTKK